jgi:uncharacterized protein DUF4199
MKKFSIEIRWGIQFSLISIVWMILEKIVGLHDAYVGMQLIYTNLFGLVAIAIYFLELRDKKKHYYNGQMDWRQGFVSGVVLTVVITLLCPMVNGLIYTYVTPQFFDRMIAHRVSKGLQTQAQAQAYFNLMSYTVMGVFDALSKGIITAALVALFVKTKKNPK